MALIRTSGLISDMKGKIGGGILQGSQNGLILKANVKNVRSSTILSGTIKNLFAKISFGWSNLTDNQRNIWETYSKYNPRKAGKFSPRFMNGRELYFFLNQYYYPEQEALASAPIFTPRSFPDTSYTMDYDGASLKIIATPSMTRTYALVLNTTGAIKPTINNWRNKTKQFNKILPEVSSFLILNTFFLSKFGRVPIIGETVGFEVALFSMDDIELSDWTSYKQVIT